jgi:septation ring formation regulator EzrA
MATTQPRWLTLVLRFERAIGVPVEAAVRSDTYFDLLTHAKRTQARLTELTEGVTQGWLHLLNVPASSDVRRLREQLARVERQLGEIATELEEQNDVRNGKRGRAAAP